MIAQDHAQGKEQIGVMSTINLKDKGNWTGEYHLNKYDFSSLTPEERMQAEEDHKTLSSAAMKEKWGSCFVSDEVIGYNLLLNAGINVLMNLLGGAAATAFNNANGRIGVGDSSTAASASQTGLQAATNKTYQAFDSTYPTTGASQQFIARATFASGSANYSWQEFTIDNGTTSLNRLVSNQGTKTSGQSWQITVTLTIS